MAEIDKTTWTFIGQDVGIRRVSGGVSPANLNSAYSLKVPMNYAGPTSTWNSSYYLTELPTSIQDTQFISIFGSFGFDTNPAKAMFFGVACRATVVSGVYDDYYLALVGADEVGTRACYLYKSVGGVESQLETTVFLPYTPTVNDPIGVSLVVGEAGITVATSTDGLNWVDRITSTDTSITERGTMFFMTRLSNVHVPEAGDVIHLDDVVLSNSIVS